MFSEQTLQVIPNNFKMGGPKLKDPTNTVSEARLDCVIQVRKNKHEPCLHASIDRFQWPFPGRLLQRLTVDTL